MATRLRSRFSRLVFLAHELAAVAAVSGSCAGSSLEKVSCSDECPAGTRRTSYDKVVAGDAFTLVGSDCEIICEAILPCVAPNVPRATRDASGTTYVCEPFDGFSAIPTDAEVDFSWASTPAHCFDGNVSGDEEAVDCGGACGACARSSACTGDAECTAN